MKNILKYLLSLLVMVGAAGFMACSSDGDDGEQYLISFAQNPVMSGIDGGQFSVQVTTEFNWTASPADAWITDVTSSGTGSGTLNFTVTASSENAFRDGKINLTVPGSSYVKQLTVRQMGLDGGLLIDPTPVAFDTHGGVQNIAIYAVTGWEIDRIDGDWFKVEQKNTSSLTVTTTPNFTGDVLDGGITLKDPEGNHTYSIPVSQEYDNALFLGATTPMGRRFVYYCDGLVQDVISDEQYAVNDRVDALEIGFMGTATGIYAPYRMFLFEVRLGNGTTLRMTTANDEDSSIKATSAEWTEMQITRGQLAAMQNKRSATLDVLAGVNGDFCFGASSYPDSMNVLHGVMYRNGVCLKKTFSGGVACTVFALMTDGTARVMTQAQYAAATKSDIYEAIGGRQILLSGGQNVSNEATLEPRTAVGVSREGDKVYLLVVDGRRESYSIGASYPIMSKMFLAMGAYEAINLDGGGSSTFALKTSTAMPATADSFETRNMPTDTSGDRAIPNGIAIVKLKN